MSINNNKGYKTPKEWQYSAFFALNMEVIHSSETLVTTYKTNLHGVTTRAVSKVSKAVRYTPWRHMGGEEV
jgi:hypothetical protein